LPIYNTEKFITAQEHTYLSALAEITAGKKQGHWMWFIFPQLKGLGYSGTSKFYGIENAHEARQYLQHQILGGRLRDITIALLKIEEKTAREIFGTIDDLKLKSCMTLFASVDDDANEIFKAVLTKYFDGQQDERTLQMLAE
jgi:uncharacterized protein (DUF1810 family)